jgi:hypothetical protein
VHQVSGYLPRYVARLAFLGHLAYLDVLAHLLISAVPMLAVYRKCLFFLKRAKRVKRAM